MPMSTERGAQRLPDEESAPSRLCPYCGAAAVRDAEEGPGDGIQDVTISICAACGRSTSKLTWTPASTRRALLLAVRTLGLLALFAVASWLLTPLLSRFPLRSTGAT